MSSRSNKPHSKITQKRCEESGFSFDPKRGKCLTIRESNKITQDILHAVVKSPTLYKDKKFVQKIVATFKDDKNITRRVKYALKHSKKHSKKH